MQPLTEEQRIQKAEQASTMAFVAVVLCLMVNCGGCFTVFVALPLSLWALSLARVALDGDPPDLARAYAVPARNNALATAVFSGLLILLIVGYITLYIGIFGLAFVMAAVGP